MKKVTYAFTNKEDRESAYNNIVKWFGSEVVSKVDFLEIRIDATQNAIGQLQEIAEKHDGHLKHS